MHFYPAFILSSRKSGFRSFRQTKFSASFQEMLKVSTCHMIMSSRDPYLHVLEFPRYKQFNFNPKPESRLFNHYCNSKGPKKIGLVHISASVGFFRSGYSLIRSMNSECDILLKSHSQLMDRIKEYLDRKFQTNTPMWTGPSSYRDTFLTFGTL